MLINSPSLAEELKVYKTLKNIDRIVNLYNFNLENVLCKEDLDLSLHQEPDIWKFKDLIYFLTNLR